MKDQYRFYNDEMDRLEAVGKVKVLRVDNKDRKIGLSRKDLHGGVPENLPPEPEIPEEEDIRITAPPPADRSSLRGGTGAAGPLIQMPGKS